MSTGEQTNERGRNMVTLGEVMDKVRKAGIARTTGTFARDAEGTPMEVPLRQKPASCCMLGALIYAEEMGWCSQSDADRFRLTFHERTGVWVSTANDKLGYTFADFVAVVDRNEVKA